MGRKKQPRACALDLGAVRVGVAVSDELGVLAHPRGNLAARPVPKFLAALNAIVVEEKIKHIVVGLPLDMKGGEGDSAKRARGLAQLIADETGCDVLLWDERWSTKQAARALAASEVRGKKAKARIDEASACAILQAWLDRESTPRVNAREPRDTPDGAQSGEKGVRRRRRKRRRVAPKPRIGKLAVLLLVLGAAVAVALVGIVFVYPHTKGPGDGKPIQIDFSGTESTGEIASALENAGLISHPTVFTLYAKIARLNTDLIAGTHLLTDDQSPAEIILALERRGFATKVKVTFPEGFTRFDMARRLYEKRVCTEASFLRASTDAALLRRLNIEGESAEGYLFPATYDFSVDSDPAEIIARQKTEFDRRFQVILQSHQLGKADLENSLSWGTKEIVTLASMIEKEAAVDDERPIIASVFLNRLRDATFKRHVLQSDPTSAYGCLVAKDQIKACAGFSGKITHDLNVDPDNMYSTYVHEKLPPGPICNPGAKSLDAVLGPATTKYLYFVARGQSRHTFSETLEAHNQAVKPAP